MTFDRTDTECATGAFLPSVDHDEAATKGYVFGLLVIVACALGAMLMRGCA